MEGVEYKWVVFESPQKSVSNGDHFIFTTFSHHVGEEIVGVRAALNAEATRIAARLLGLNYRLINNSGPDASTLTHYHVRLIKPGEGERLPKAVANVQKIVEERGGIGSDLGRKLLQQK